MNASRTYLLAGLLLASVAAFGFSTAPANAAPPPCTENCAPPPGAVIDLSGEPLPVNDPTSYSFAINEAYIPSGDAPLTFFFRDDYAYIDIYDVALYDTSSATPTVNLLANGDFSGGVTSGTDIPKGWTYVDPSSESGLFLAGSYDKLCVGNVQCWSDGTAQGYDGLSQSVNWKSGDQYTISFVATVNGVVAVPSANPSLPASNASEPTDLGASQHEQRDGLRRERRRSSRLYREWSNSSPRQRLRRRLRRRRWRTPPPSPRPGP